MRTRRWPTGTTQRHGRRAAVIVQVAVMSTVIIGFGALAIDVGMLYTTKTELQAAADSGALAAAAQLAGEGNSDPADLARQTAEEFVHKHRVFGTLVDLNPATDVELGKSIYDTSTQRFEFQPSTGNYDAVRVTVKRTSDSVNGSVPLMFANIWGTSQKDMWARAAAVLIPRDIAVVIDLSGSMNDDSELRHYKRFQGEEGDWRDGIQVNLRDIWCALNGPEPSRPYIPGGEAETEYASDTGPSIGALPGWGSEVVTETYDPVTDPGLWYIKKNVNCTVAAAQTSLQARGYSDDEINCLMSAARDSLYTNQWRNRTAVILGLATWNSGRPGGHPGGDGDDRVEDNVTHEFSWAAYPSFRPSGSSWTWADFVNYVGGSSQMTVTNPNLQWRFGLKTFTNFLLENRSSYSQTNVLWQTPEQPVRAVKDAVQAMTDVIVSLDSLDHVSLEIFAQTAHHEVNLSEDLQAVPNRLYQMQSAHYDSYTNMGGGLLTGMNELASSRARSAAAKVIVLMSDGKPNIDQQGDYQSEGNPAVNQWVLDLAEQAANSGMRIYTVSVGQDADQALMAAIASAAHGQHFHAEGTPEEYADELELIFRTLGGKRPVVLIE